MGSELIFPTAEIFKTRKLGLTCRIWWAHSCKVNYVIVSSSQSPRGFFFLYYPQLAWWVAFVPKLTFSLAASEERTLGPSSCPWAVLLYWHPSWTVNSPAVHCQFSFRYSNTTPVLSLMWSYLVFEDDESGIEVMLCSPFKTTRAAEGQRSQTRTGGQRGQGKKRRELNSSNFSCWVFLCVMTIWGSWGYFEALVSVLLCP